MSIELAKKIELLTAERDYFKASYARTLDEHAETLRLASEAEEKYAAACARLERERDAALLKLERASRELADERAEAQAHAALLREELESHRRAARGRASW